MFDIVVLCYFDARSMLVVNLFILGFVEASEPDFESVPRRRRSELDQVVDVSPVKQLHKQLCDVMNEEPEVFMKKSVDGDVLVSREDNGVFAENETALGAKLLNSRVEDLGPSESVASSNMKTPYVFVSPENDGNHGDDQGASSSA